jgi:hypothetical protein
MDKNHSFPPICKINTPYVQQISVSPQADYIFASGLNEGFRVDRGLKSKPLTFQKSTQYSFQKGIIASTNTVIGIVTKLNNGVLTNEQTLLFYNQAGEPGKELVSDIAKENVKKISSVAASNKGELIAAFYSGIYGKNSYVVIWNAAGKQLAKIADPKKEPQDVGLTFSANDQYILYFSYGQLVKINSTTFEVERITLISDETSGYSTCAYINAGNNRHILTQIADNRGWTVLSEKGEVINSCTVTYSSELDLYFTIFQNGNKQRGGIERVIMMPDGEHVLEAGEKILLLRNITNQNIVKKIVRKKNTQIRDVALTNDGWIGLAVDNGIEFYHLDEMMNPKDIQIFIDLTVQSTGDTWSVKGPKGEVQFQHTIKSIESEEPDSKHPRMECELQFYNGKKWELFIESSTHGSYSSEDSLVLEDGSMHEKILKKITKQLGTKMNPIDAAMFIAGSSPAPLAYQVVVES